MIQVDVFGSYVICGASSLIGAGMMRLARPGEPHMQEGLATCSWAFALLGLGLFQFVFASRDPPWWSLLLGTIGASVGTAMFGWGVARFAGRRLNDRLLAPLVGLLVLTLGLLQRYTGPTAFATSFDVICFLIASLVVVGQRSYLLAPRNRAEFVLGVALAIYAVTWVLRGCSSLLNVGPVKPHMLYLPEPLTTAFAVFYGTIPIIISALMLNMVNAHLNDRLRAHAITDDLTGLKSRRALRDVDRDAVLAADPKARGVAALIVDIDHFKAVNDNLGHAVGDRVLVHVARTLERSVRPGALVTRYGGEEFVVLLPAGDLDQAHRAGERLRARVESRPFNNRATKLTVTVSIGLAFWAQNEKLEAALKRADDALYSAKASGRNLVMADTRKAA